MANVERRVDAVVAFINVEFTLLLLAVGLCVFGGNFADCVVPAIFDFILIITFSFSVFESSGMARNSSVNFVSVVTVFNFLFLTANKDLCEAFFFCGSIQPVLCPTKPVFRGSIALMSRQDFGESFFFCGSVQIVLYPTKEVFRGSTASISKQRRRLENSDMFLSFFSGPDFSVM